MPGRLFWCAFGDRPIFARPGETIECERRPRMADDDLADGQVNEETEATPESEAAAEGGAEEREEP